MDRFLQCIGSYSVGPSRSCFKILVKSKTFQNIFFFIFTTVEFFVEAPVAKYVGESEVIPTTLICGPQVVENESRTTLDGDLAGINAENYVEPSVEAIVNTTTENTQAENGEIDLDAAGENTNLNLPDELVEHWYRNATFMKAYQYSIQLMPNMKMWPESENPSIEPPEPKSMPVRPKRCRRRAKDEPRKKIGKLSKKGVKMTCSKCHQLGHNKSACKSEPSTRDTTQASNPTQRSQPTTIATIMRSIPSLICEDTSGVRRSGQSQSKSRGRGRGLVLGRGYFRSPAAAIGGRDTSNVSSNIQQAHETQQAAGYKRPRQSAFGIYQDTMTGRSILNPGAPSERVIACGTFRDASATNIDIGFKPNGLKWKGKKAVTISQLQRMSATRNRRTSSQPMECNQESQL